MARIKGFAIRGLLKFVKHKEYPGGIPELIGRLPPTSQAAFESQIVTSRWYPYEPFADLLDLICREVGKGDQMIIREAGRRAGHEDVATIFKIILSIASMETVVKRGSIFWQKYCDTGRLEVRETKPGWLRAHLLDFPGMHPLHCELVNGWNQGIGLSCGAKDVVSRHIECVGRGGSECVWEAEWMM